LKRFFRYLKVNFLYLARKLVIILKEKIEHKTFLIIAGLLVGVTSGLAAALLKKVVHFFQQEPKLLFSEHGLQFLSFLTPLAGILLSLLIINLIFGGHLTRGLSNVIYFILRKNSNIPPRAILSHMLTSGVTIGLGGSAGLEAPIVVMGASIGSNIARELKLNYQSRTLLLACGAAAGISAIFNSPIAGVIFAFEVLLPEVTVSSFIPLLIASASSAVLSKFLYSGQLFYLVTEGWHLYAIPYYILLGILCGFISLYMIKSSIYLEQVAEKYKRQYLKALVGGLILCLFIYIIPPLYGEGYSTVITLLSGKYNNLLSGSIFSSIPNPELALLIFSALIIVTKVIATSLTLGSGGNGGIIAPSLFTGAITGFLLAHAAAYFGLIQLNHVNFIVVGMAGVLSGVLHAPLTGIFLIAEITGGYALIVPLMIVTALSFFISRHFHPHSIYTTALAKRGILFRSEKEKYFVQQLKLNDLIENDFVKIKPDMTFRQLVEQITKTKRNLFPVVDDTEKLIGIVTLDDVREVMIDKEVYDVILVNEVMKTNFESVDINIDVNGVIQIFEEKQIWNLAVTDKNKYVGFISKSNLFNKYISIWAQHRKEEIV
jgi:CIC family chloride channel protein